MLNNEYFNQHVVLQRLQFAVLLPSSCPNWLTLYGGYHDLQDGVRASSHVQLLLVIFGST